MEAWSRAWFSTEARALSDDVVPNTDSGPCFIAGLDENGLGARLGPMLVTGVLVEADAGGRRWMRRNLSKGLARDLDDSKKLVSFKDAVLGEAWARALAPKATTPQELVGCFSLSSEDALRQRCPQHSERQCWTVSGEHFRAEPELLRRVRGHVERFRDRGVRIAAVRSEILCVRRLNDERDDGGNRFVSDLHAMERLLLEFRKLAGAEILAHCGKVGGMQDYDKYFGPLSGHLRVTLKQTRAESAYRFPSVGEVRFQKDADASHPVVMLASIVGKYLREILMARISDFYVAENARIQSASGYHDPVTSRLVQLSRRTRRRLDIADACFERASDA